MTRKHFVAIAGQINSERVEALARGCKKDGVEIDTLNKISIRLADVCAEFNRHFDRHTFLEACGNYTNL